jgi:hypothetical protein
MYAKTERLLVDLKRLNDRYLKLTLPRLNELLVSANDPRNSKPRLARSENCKMIDEAIL